MGIMGIHWFAYLFHCAGEEGGDPWANYHNAEPLSAEVQLCWQIMFKIWTRKPVFAECGSM